MQALGEPLLETGQQSPPLPDLALLDLSSRPLPTAASILSLASTAFAAPNRGRGWLLALLAVLAVSPDALLLRYIRRSGAPLVLIITIKYALMGAVQAGLFVGMQGGAGRTLRALRRRGAPYVWLASGFMLATQVGFTISLLETTAANAIVLFSLNPLWAALLGWAWLGDAVPAHTVAAMLVAAVAVCVAFLPQVLGDKDAQPAPAADGASRPTLHGNVCALLTGATLAAFITASRAGALRTPGAPMGIAPSLGSFGAAIGAALVLPFVGVSAASLAAIDPGLFFAAVVADAILEAVYDLWSTPHLPLLEPAPGPCPGPRAEPSPPRPPHPPTPHPLHPHSVSGAGGAAHLGGVGGARPPPRDPSRPMVRLPRLRRAALRVDLVTTV